MFPVVLRRKRLSSVKYMCFTYYDNVMTVKEQLEEHAKAGYAQEIRFSISETEINYLKHRAMDSHTCITHKRSMFKSNFPSTSI